MTVEQALKYPVNPFDATKVWRPEEFPLIDVGEFVLNENPVDQFNDMEQLAFSPECLLDECSLILMLKDIDLGSILLRLRDGFMAENPNGDADPIIFLIAFMGLVKINLLHSVFHVNGIVDRFDTVDDLDDNYRLVRLYLYKDLTSEHRRRVARNLGGSLAGARRDIAERAIRNMFLRITPEFGKQVWDDMLEKIASNDISKDE
ncbi:unnamed protein product [Orchesella dallaii]|uniref:Catalase core domain-containing protein n=1 Tax=Orchesella dallaii TaxID=48710 RepID=A0ABP1RWX2_9HEXA